MNRLIGSEVTKLRTTRTFLGVTIGAIGLVIVISLIASLAGSFGPGDTAPGADLMGIAGIVQLFTLVLDEPANGLDPQGIRWLRDFLRSLAAEGRAVLVSSHVLAEVAQTADEVVVINHGRAVAQAPLAELMARSGGGVRVLGPDVTQLRTVLESDGATVAGDGAEIVVRDRSGEQIGRLIAEHRLVVSELAPVASSLEDVFFELTEAEASGGPS